MKKKFKSYYSYLVFVLCIIVCFTNCSNRNHLVYGVWQVSEGRNQGAIFDFSENDRLYIYGGNVQFFWYGFEIESTKSISNSNFITETTNIGEITQQGNIDWKNKNEIKFWPEMRKSQSEITIAHGPIYKIIECSSTIMKIEEKQAGITSEGNTKMFEVGDMTLIPFHPAK